MLLPEKPCGVNAKFSTATNRPAVNCPEKVLSSVLVSYMNVRSGVDPTMICVSRL